MRWAGRVFIRGCIWAVSFNVLLVLWVAFFKWLLDGTPLSETGVAGPIFLVLGIGMAGAISQDVSRAALPPIEDKEPL